MLNESLILELKWWLKKHYPPFVYSSARSFSPGGVPVFIFHSVEAARFELQLQFLSENNYYTPSSDEFYEYISGKLALPPRSALLTFDDGDTTLYDAAYPILRKYGLRAVCFICPGLISGEKRKNTGSPFAVWDEIMEMEKSGAVDFQSHTLDHERIFSGDKILDFLNPSSFKERLGLSIPTAHSEEGFTRLVSLGSPLYETDSRMSKSLRYYDDRELRQRCVDYAARRGGMEFFNRKAWRRELCEFAAGKKKECRGGSFEDETRRREEILYSLSESKKLLGEKLGKSVSHLAYPWGYGSRTSVELSRKAGYLTNFWGPLERPRISLPGINPYYIPRLKGDYLFRLPGKGRKSIAEIFGYKLARRAVKEDIY